MPPLTECGHKNIFLIKVPYRRVSFVPAALALCPGGKQTHRHRICAPISKLFF
jgi:hypothetical protein